MKLVATIFGTIKKVRDSSFPDDKANNTRFFYMKKEFILFFSSLIMFSFTTYAAQIDQTLYSISKWAEVIKDQSFKKECSYKLNSVFEDGKNEQSIGQIKQMNNLGEVLYFKLDKDPRFSKKSNLKQSSEILFLIKDKSFLVPALTNENDLNGSSKSISEFWVELLPGSFETAGETQLIAVCPESFEKRKKKHRPLPKFD